MILNDIKIVNADENDISDILEIEQASFSLPWSRDSFKAEVNSADSHFTVAKFNNNVIGFCILHMFGNEAEIFNVAVSEVYRGNHIGDLLLNEALGFADSSSIEQIFLEARKSNSPAISLYSKHGFKALGSRKNYYDAPQEDAIIMQRLHV